LKTSMTTTRRPPGPKSTMYSRRNLRSRRPSAARHASAKKSSSIGASTSMRETHQCGWFDVALDRH
jgi:hypothetical protein